MVSLMLSGCNNQGTDSVSIRSIPSISAPESDKEINSVDNPYTVAQFLEYCDKNVAKTQNTFSDGYFHVKALAKEISFFESSDSIFFKIVLGDTVDAEQEVPAFKIQKADGVNANIVYKGDEVLVAGYGEYYDGRFTLYPRNDFNPTLKKYTKKSVAVTLEDGKHVTYDTDPAGEHENGSTVSFTPTASNGYVVKYVLANGIEIQPNSEGKYSFEVNGPTKLLVRDVPASLVEEDLPKGEYKLTLEKSNLPLPLNYGSYDTEAVSTSFEVEGKEDTFDKLYKKVKVDFSEGCVNSYKYNEFGLNKGKSMAISVDQESMLIKTVDIDFYYSCSSFIYNAADDSDDTKEVKGTEGESKYSDGVYFSYDINGKNFFMKNDESAQYSNMIYYMTITLTVE